MTDEQKILRRTPVSWNRFEEIVMKENSCSFYISKEMACNYAKIVNLSDVEVTLTYLEEIGKIIRHRPREHEEVIFHRPAVLISYLRSLFHHDLEALTKQVFCVKGRQYVFPCYQKKDLKNDPKFKVFKESVEQGYFKYEIRFRNIPSCPEIMSKIIVRLYGLISCNDCQLTITWRAGIIMHLNCMKAMITMSECDYGTMCVSMEVFFLKKGNKKELRNVLFEIYQMISESIETVPGLRQDCYFICYKCKHDAFYIAWKDHMEIVCTKCGNKISLYSVSKIIESLKPEGAKHSVKEVKKFEQEISNNKCNFYEHKIGKIFTIDEEKLNISEAYASECCKEIWKNISSLYEASDFVEFCKSDHPTFKPYLSSFEFLTKRIYLCFKAYTEDINVTSIVLSFQQVEELNMAGCELVLLIDKFLEMPNLKKLDASNNLIYSGNFKANFQSYGLFDTNSDTIYHSLLKHLPETLLNMKDMQELIAYDNRLEQIPNDLFKIELKTFCFEAVPDSVHTFLYEGNPFIYPQESILNLGLHGIKKYLHDSYEIIYKEPEARIVMLGEKPVRQDKFHA
ncbi:hypothetical protein GQR58_010077 [Nymphon striatum]|nr:hypothetical protein GQR58_010077 [Nymphon striatum]